MSDQWSMVSQITLRPGFDSSTWTIWKPVWQDFALDRLAERDSKLGNKTDSKKFRQICPVASLLKGAAAFDVKIQIELSKNDKRVTKRTKTMDKDRITLLYNNL